MKRVLILLTIALVFASFFVMAESSDSDSTLGISANAQINSDSNHNNSNGSMDSGSESESENDSGNVVCTLEVKICPDGTKVGRSGSDCEFKCPEDQRDLPEDKVCCMVYGYGANMNKVNIHYEITDNGECIIPENFVGGNREVVNNSYCIRNLLRERDRIRAHYENESECPSDCSCSGSTVKCELENGTRILTIHAGNSNNTIIQIKGINATTQVMLYRDGEKVYGVFRNNLTSEVILPDEIRKRIQNQTRLRLQNESMNLTKDGHYIIEARKQARLFWIIPVQERARINVSAQSGDITDSSSSWWGFLARDVKSDSTN